MYINTESHQLPPFSLHESLLLEENGGD